MRSTLSKTSRLAGPAGAGGVVARVPKGLASGDTTDNGRAGAGLLAHIAVSKYDDHLPLYRQAEIFAREGVKLETSTLSGWVGATAAALSPLIDALAADMMASDTLHIDVTPVPVLAPGTGKAKTGRLWTYVRDERPFAGARPPAALFFYSPDRKGAHPQSHLKAFRGTIHADGYAGFNELFGGNRIVEAACWGPCAAQVLRCACRQWLPDRKGGARTHWQALRDREGHQRPHARPPPTRTSSAAGLSPSAAKCHFTDSQAPRAVMPIFLWS